MRVRLVLYCAVLSVLSSCATYLALDQPYEEPPATPDPGPYRISTGDRLSVEFARNAIPVATYRLGVGDMLSVRVHDHRELDLDTTINPDGSITYHRIGVIQAAGRTVEELRAQIANDLSAHYNEPDVAVFLNQSDASTERFLEMLLRSPTGSTRSLTVNGGGLVSVPGVGLLSLSGMTLREAEDTINRKLQANLPGMMVILNSTRDSNATFTVVGEVNGPGTFRLGGVTTLVDALSTAGWKTEYGDMTRVLLMSEVAPNEIDARVYNVEDAMAHGNSLPQVRVRPSDTVLVLRTGVGNSNEAVEHYIRRHLPIQVGAAYRIQNE